MSDQEKQLLRQVEAHIRIFIKTGDRMVFGRLEGIKDAVALLGSPELMTAIVEAVKRNEEEMAGVCA